MENIAGKKGAELRKDIIATEMLTIDPWMTSEQPVCERGSCIGESC